MGKITKKSRTKGRRFTDEDRLEAGGTRAAAMRHAFAPHHAHNICLPKMESRKKAMVIFGEFQEALYGLTVRSHMEEEEVIYTKE